MSNILENSALKDKNNDDLKFFYNNTLFKDFHQRNKPTGIKRIVTLLEKSLNASNISNSSSESLSYGRKQVQGIKIGSHRQKLVNKL
jgi:hypothetical protein